MAITADSLREMLVYWLNHQNPAPSGRRNPSQTGSRGMPGRSRLWQNFRETHLTYSESYLARLN